MKVRGREWQEEYLHELANYLNSFITEVVSVPEHLKLTLPVKFSPKRLLKMFSLEGVPDLFTEGDFHLDSGLKEEISESNLDRRGNLVSGRGHKNCLYKQRSNT